MYYNTRTKAVVFLQLSGNCVFPLINRKVVKQAAPTAESEYFDPLRGRLAFDILFDGKLAFEGNHLFIN